MQTENSARPRASWRWAGLVTLLTAVALAATACPARAGYWTMTAVPDPNAARIEVRATNLESVSCLSRQWCFAVGGTYSEVESARSFAAQWDGSRWTMVAPPADDLLGVLTTVSCAAPTFCVATATGSNQLHVWDGRLWSAVTPPPGDTGATDFESVSCTAVDHCMAVGNAGGTSGVSLWDGSAWRSLPSPNRYGPADLVACAAADLCIEGGRNQRRWSGDTWRPVPVGHSLDFVSCTRDRFCLLSDGTHVSVGDGDTWRSVALPDGVGLRSVSCVSATFCVGVGISGTDPLAPRSTLVFDGRVWTFGAGSPNLFEPFLVFGDAAARLPMGLSCVPRWCMRVGGTPSVPLTSETDARLVRYKPAAEQLRL